MEDQVGGDLSGEHGAVGKRNRLGWVCASVVRGEEDIMEQKETRKRRKKNKVVIKTECVALVWSLGTEIDGGVVDASADRVEQCIIISMSYCIWIGIVLCLRRCVVLILFSFSNISFFFIFGFWILWANGDCVSFVGCLSLFFYSVLNFFFFVVIL